MDTSLILSFNSWDDTSRFATTIKISYPATKVDPPPFQTQSDSSDKNLQRQQSPPDKKSSHKNLEKGKISLPIIHSMQNSSPIATAQITCIFKGRDANGLLPELKAWVLRHLDERMASFAYTRRMLKRMEGDLKEAVEKVSGVPNPLLKSLLAKLEL